MRPPVLSPSPVPVKESVFFVRDGTQGEMDYLDSRRKTAGSSRPR